MIEFYTSYFGNYKNIPQEYQCFSIANSKPSGINIPRLEEAVPKWSYVKSFKSNEISWQLFSDMYLNRLIQKHYNFDFEERLSKYDTKLVFLCWEKDVNKCHRSIFAKYLENFYCFKYFGEL